MVCIAHIVLYDGVRPVLGCGGSMAKSRLGEWNSHIVQNACVLVSSFGQKSCGGSVGGPGNSPE